MSTVKPTHVVMKAPKKTDATDQKSALEARAARFGLSSTGSSTAASASPATTGTDKSTLEARAARFGLSTSAGKTTGGPVAVNSTVDPSKLAARAARFADIMSPPATKTTSSIKTSTAASSGDADILAKRASRFADISKEPASKNATAATRSQKP